MRDRDVRAALHERLREQHACDSDTTIVDEVSFCGEVRADVLVVNGSLSGFELKSERDNLRRLPRQVEVYSKVLDSASLVVAECHLDAALELLPKWWGVITATSSSSGAKLRDFRPAGTNDAIDAYSLAQLLWKDESLDILRSHGLHRGYVSKPRRVIWAHMAASLPLDVLRDAVRMALKHRDHWRVDR